MSYTVAMPQPGNASSLNPDLSQLIDTSMDTVDKTRFLKLLAFEPPNDVEGLRGEMERVFKGYRGSGGGGEDYAPSLTSDSVGRSNLPVVARVFIEEKVSAIANGDQIHVHGILELVKMYAGMDVTKKCGTACAKHIDRVQAIVRKARKSRLTREAYQDVQTEFKKIVAKMWRQMPEEQRRGLSDEGQGRGRSRNRKIEDVYFEKKEVETRARLRGSSIGRELF